MPRCVWPRRTFAALTMVIKNKSRTTKLSAKDCQTLLRNARLSETARFPNDAIMKTITTRKALRVCNDMVDVAKEVFLVDSVILITVLY
ncbi:MAG: hypothetical protein GXP40_12730 [Chloroflexi bacterium]|nr:hypothetical protein [Chloroflexota bacterium]